MGDKSVIGYWISEKKRQKFNCNDVHNVCAKEGLVLKEVDINSSLESQGPFHIFLHKLTDVLAHAQTDDQNARAVVTRVQDYIHRHPEMIVIDPIENVRKLSNRHKTYQIIQSEIQSNDVFTPNSVELMSKSITENLSHLRRVGIKFPFICKPLLAHGSSDAHKMMVIFNENGLKDCQPPCVAQDFVNHSAILYKVFIVGNNFNVVERPSLKNFYAKDCESLNTLFFSSHHISKSGSNSEWSVISADDEALRVQPKYEIFERIVAQVTQIFGLVLVGADVVIENHTGKYAIIDVNVFPGYDGYPNFSKHLVESIKRLLNEQRNDRENFRSCILKKCLSDDLDSGFESDEKKKKHMKIIEYKLPIGFCISGDCGNNSGKTSQPQILTVTQWFDVPSCLRTGRLGRSFA